MFSTYALFPYRPRSFPPLTRLLGALAHVFAVLLAFPLSAARAELMYGVRADRMLVSFDSATPGALTDIAPITGIQGDIDALALRPANGQWYAFTTYGYYDPVNGTGPSRQLYTINMVTGIATKVGGADSAGGAHHATYLSAVAFNPLDDTLRGLRRTVRRGGVDYTSNLNFNPNTGAETANYGQLAYAAGDVNAGKKLNFSRMAYALSPAGSVTLYGFEGNNLVTIGNVGGSPVSANDKQVFTVAPVTGAGLDDAPGFTISASTGVAYVSTNGNLYTLNLSTGQLTLVGNFGVDMIGIAVAPPPPAPVSKWTPVDVAVNQTDNTSRLLWKESTNRYAVWKLSEGGVIQTGKYYGPITGYTCEQIVVAPNGETTLLWKNPATKQAALWTLAPDLSAITKATVYNYPTNYTPQNIAADANSKIRMTWRKTNNAIALWTITPATGAITGSAVYGPVVNLQDGPIAVGADGNVRLVWNNASTGGATLWTLAAAYGAPLSAYNYGPVAGATASRLAVGPDNKARLQWTYTTGADAGKIALWKVDTTVGGTGTVEANKSYGPIAHVAPLGLSVGSDNQTRLLWKYATGDKTGRAALWVLDDPLTTITKAYTYGPIY